MKIIITGGAGFIASHIADSYITLGHKVVIIDNLSSGLIEYINKKAKFYKADIRNRDEVRKILHEEKPDIINHHAAQISVRNSVENPQNDANINILGLLNLLEEGKNIGIKKFIFASSGGVVYGEANQIPTPETYIPLQPLSPYGVTKLASELYLNYYFQTYKIPYIALRYSNVYGPRQNPHGEAGVVAIFSLKLLRGEKPVINGDGMQVRDYVFVEDVARVNVKAIDSDISGSYNIGTGIQTNVIQIFEKIKEVTSSSLEARHGPAKTGEQKISCLDCTKAYQILGWKPEFDLTKGMKKTVEFFRKL